MTGLLLASVVALSANCGGGDTRKGNIKIGPGAGGAAGESASGGNGGSVSKTGGTSGTKTGGTTAGGSGGTTSGGAGGTATGGAGGTATGGTATGGTATGGTGGTATGGSGGTATGGTGGASTGGTGGTVVVTPPGPIAAPTSRDFFTGKGANVSTIVNGDAKPGYFYATGSFATAPTVAVQALSAEEQTGLPAGITHAQRSNNPLTGGLIIVGFNFRADDGTAWRWIDASAYAGITLWARTANATPLDGNFTTVDAGNVLTSDPPTGACAARPCVAVPGKAMTVTSTWQQFKYRFTDLAQDPALPAAEKGPVNIKQLGRVDILFGLGPNVNADLFITGVSLATAAELQ